MGKVKLELTFNPQTSMVGIRLHEHTLSDTKTGIYYNTYTYTHCSVLSMYALRSDCGDVHVSTNK